MEEKSNKELHRDAEILRGNIDLYRQRIANWQASVNKMKEELPVMEAELRDIWSKIGARFH